MRKFLKAFVILVLCWLPFSAVAEDKIPDPVISGFQLKQVGDEIVGSFAFRNIQGGILKAAVTTYIFVRGGGTIYSESGTKKIEPQQVRRLIYYGKGSEIGGYLEFMIPIPEEMFKKETYVRVDIHLQDSLGRMTDIEIGSLTYEKRLKI